MRLFKSRKSTDNINNNQSVIPYENDPQITIVSCNSHAYNSFITHKIENLSSSNHSSNVH